LIFEVFPASRLIFLLRDGRDVVDSWMDAYQRGSWAIDEGAFAVAPHGRLALVEWLASVWAYRARAVGAAFDSRAPEARVLVRYEDLLADPARELGRICEVIGVDAARGELERIAERHAFAKVDDARRGEGQEIRAAEPGSWRRNLTPEEGRAMEEIMGSELATFGYGTELSYAA
jgi:hypothetical protein